LAQTKKTMAIKTVTFQRVRSELEACVGATVADMVTAYNTYEATKAADATKSWTVRAVNSYFDGINFICIAEGSYPEINEDPLDQVPPLP